MDNNKITGCCRNPKLILLLVGMILLAGIVTVSLLRDRIVNPPQWQVSVIGQGKVVYQPDIANVILGVQIDKVSNPQDALNELNTKVDKVVSAIKTVGIPAEDIQTQNYSLNPQYDYANNVTNLAGYSANQQLVIKVRNLKEDSDSVSKVVGAAAKAGVNQITSVTFDVSNLEALKQEARLLAITDAKNKSQVLATAAGVKLGKVVGWWENFIQSPGLPTAYSDGKGGMGSGIASPVLPTGTQEIIVEINLSYQVK